MNDNDLTLTMARCLQNFMDVERHDPNMCYVNTLENLNDRAKVSYFNDALFHRKVDILVHAVNEHTSELRSQVAELQRQLEQAKQEPYGWFDTECNQMFFDRHERSPATEIPLYALPPNLPAMIEQAVREEREAFTKMLDTPIRQYFSERELRLVFSGIEERDDFASWMIAIRARGEKA